MSRTAAEPRPAGQTLRQLLAQSWQLFHPLPALYCAPAVVGVLAAGLALGRPGPAILATAGAFSVGFGAFQKVSRLHVAPMLLAAIAMGVSTAVGTVAAINVYADAACVAAAGFSLGLATGFGTGPWWVLLQGAIFLVVSGSVPGDLAEGLARAGLVLGGGCVQTASVALLRALAPRGFPPLEGPTATPHPETLREWEAAARRVVGYGAPEWRYGFLLALAAGFAVLLAHRLGFQNSYWMAMTVLIVLRRGAAETVTRGTLRIAGTLVGAGVATLVVALIRPPPWALAPLIAVAAWGAYAFQWVNYGTFSVCVTSYIAFLMALEGLPETVVVAHRVEATLIGGVIATAAFGLSRLWRRALRLKGLIVR